jgi:signal transduction histidine kinase
MLRAVSQDESRTRLRRRLLGIGVVSVVPLLQLGTQLVMGHDKSRLLNNLLYLVLGTPLLMVAFSAGYSWATRRRLGVFATLLVGVGLACLLGPFVGVMINAFGPHPPPRHPEIPMPPPAPYAFVQRGILFGLTYGLFSYGLWALAFVFPFAAEDARVRSLEAETLRLEAEKLRTAAELAHLRAHLQPHFLLNTLNAIAGLVTEDPKEARRLLVALGDLLRDALRDENEMQTLDEQIAWLRRYAEILETRHAGKLAFRWEIAEETRDVLLPRLLLQPLVENAVKHGALNRPGGGTVVVRTSLAPANDKVVCSVEDDGPGVPDSETRSGAFGLRAVRRRLELRWATGAELRLESSDTGTRSVVEFPPQRRAMQVEAAS